MADPETPGSPEVASALLSFSSGGDFPEATARLYRALLGAKLLVVAARDEGEDALDVRLVATPDASGEARLLTFSGERSFALAGQAAPFAVAPAPGLFAFALRHGVDYVSIDSGGPVGAVLERWELEALAGGRLPNPPRRRLSMLPADPSSIGPLADALREVFPARSVFVLEETGAQPRRLLLGMVAPPPVTPGELAARLGPSLPGGEGLSLLRLSTEEASTLQRAGVEPMP